MKDTGRCPHCRREFEVRQYGRELRCPLCRRRVNVFPDPQMFIHTSIGIVGVSIVKTETLSAVAKINPTSKSWYGVLKEALKLLHLGDLLERKEK